ncbi:sortase [Chakrabartyella piscis]|uniref:sortase n=1 Tax=Chakrabartyella piscis TaxID=2918914 RepID=UPI0029586A4D|nr:sortase [Chakrabartyella piscis]
MKMNKKMSLSLMGLGFACILGAAGVLGYTQMQEKSALSFGHEVIVALEQEMQISDISGIEEMKTTAISINGQSYMGVILIPQLELELPVASTYTDALLQQTPCAFAGSIATEDLIIAAHNYTVHFGDISQLEVKDEIYLVDAAGMLHTYQLVLEETLDGSDLTGLYEGEWDLTLFTCSHMNNAKRAVLRLIEVQEETIDITSNTI